MNKYGVQVTVTEPSDNAYCVYQLIQKPGQTEYTRPGPVIWIDRADPNADQKLMQAIQLGLSGGITTTKDI